MAPNGYNQQNPKCETVYKASDSVSSNKSAAGYQPNVGTLKTLGTIDLQIMDVVIHHRDSQFEKLFIANIKYWPDSLAAEYIFVSDLFYTYNSMLVSLNPLPLSCPSHFPLHTGNPWLFSVRESVSLCRVQLALFFRFHVEVMCTAFVFLSLTYFQQNIILPKSILVANDEIHFHNLVVFHCVCTLYIHSCKYTYITSSLSFHLSYGHVVDSIS